MGFLGLAILLVSLGGLAFHTRSMWLPPLSDALWGTRYGFRVNRYGREVDDMAADQDEGNVHLIRIESEMSGVAQKGVQVAALPHQDRGSKPDEAPAPLAAAAMGAAAAHASSFVRPTGGAPRENGASASDEGEEERDLLTGLVGPAESADGPHKATGAGQHMQSATAEHDNKRAERTE